MRILTSNGFAVYIYDDEHPPPHCHVIFNNDDEVVVGLPFLECWYGKTITKKVKRYLEDNLEILLETWDNKHQKRK